MSKSNTVEIRHPIGATGELKLRNVSGRIRIVGTDGDEAVVRVTAAGGEPQLNVERSAGGLVVQPESVSFGLRVNIGDRNSLDFEVEAPRSARLSVKAVSSDIDCRAMTGEQAYKTVSGDIRLAAVAGRISAMTVSGDVRLHEAGAIELDGATTSGDLTIEALEVGQLGVRTVSGDVRVAARLLPGPRHSVETVSGDLLLDSLAGVTVESKRALDFARKNRTPTVVGDGAATLLFRSMSGEERVRSGHPAPPEAPQPPTAPEPPTAAEPAGPAAQPAFDRLAVLQALERGEIDVEEASRRLEAVSHG